MVQLYFDLENKCPGLAFFEMLSFFQKYEMQILVIAKNTTFFLLHFLEKWHSNAYDESHWFHKWMFYTIVPIFSCIFYLYDHSIFNIFYILYSSFSTAKVKLYWDYKSRIYILKWLFSILKMNAASLNNVCSIKVLKIFLHFPEVSVYFSLNKTRWKFP